jgi:hypothetical protein
MAKQPFTDEQKNLLMDYLFNKYMEDMMRSKERSEDFYNQPPPKDMLGNERIEAKSNNPFMDMISKGISNTKPEGVMTAGNTRIIELNSLIDPDMDPGDLRTIYDDMMRESGGNYPGVDFDTFLKSIGTRTASNDEAVRQLENLFEMFKEQGMSDEEAAKAARERMENAPVRKAADGGFMETLKDKFSEFVNKLKSDEPRFFAGQPLNEAAENDPRYQAILAKKVYRDLGYSDEEIDEIVKKKAGDFLELGKYLNQIESLNKAEGGIVSLADGGDPLYEMFEEVWKNTPASERATGSVKKATVRVTGDPLSYRNFLKDLGFTKIAEASDIKALGKYGVKIGDEIGSISAAANALGIKPFELRSDENFAKLVKLAEDKGVKGFTTVGGAGKASISAVEDAATGIGFRGADPGGEKIKFNQVLKAEQKDLNKIFGSNPSKAKSFEFVKRLSSAYPTLAKGAGLTALLSAAAKNAFGGPLLDLAIPTEMGMGTLMSPEDEALLISKEKIKEKFK